MNLVLALLQGIITVLLVAISLIVAVVFGVAIFIGIVYLIGTTVVLWMLGCPIDIKKSGVKIGYIRWFKFNKAI